MMIMNRNFDQEQVRTRINLREIRVASLMDAIVSRRYTVHPMQFRATAAGSLNEG